MKSKLFLIPVAIFLAFGLLSCGGSSEDNRESTVIISKTYVLDTESSTVAWNREVNYKNITTQVKLFGVMADVSMDNVEYQTNGDAVASSGYLLDVDGEMLIGDIEIDLSLTRFYSQQEESFFVNEEYPPAYIDIYAFEKNEDIENEYTAFCLLSMGETMDSISFPVEMIVVEGESVNMIGSYMMETSNWPILNQPEPENVVFDNIYFDFNLNYIFESEAEETIYEE